ncbi:MAG: transcription-repair coupling factor [Myxococcota bacterium]
MHDIAQQLQQDQSVCIREACALGQAHAVAHLLPNRRAVWLVATQQDAYMQADNLRFALARCDTANTQPAAVLTLTVDDNATPFDLAAPDAAHTMQRMAVLHHLATRQPWSALVICVKAALTLMPCFEAVRAYSQQLGVGDTLPRQTLLDKLQMAGYTRVDSVQTAGSYAVRGGIIDLFCPAFDQGVRLDLFGDCVDSIKLFDVATQRSTTALQRVHIAPVRDLFWDKSLCEQACTRMQQLATALDYSHTKLQCKLADVRNQLPFVGMPAVLPLFHHTLQSPLQLLQQACDATQLLFVTTQPQQLDQAIDAAHMLHEDSYEQARQRQQLVCEPDKLLLPKASLQQLIGCRRRVVFLCEQSPTDSHDHSYVLPCQGTSYLRQEIVAKSLPNTAQQQAQQGLLQPLATCINKLMQQGLSIWLPVSCTNRLQQLRALLLPYNLPIAYATQPPVWPRAASASAQSNQTAAAQPTCCAFVDPDAHNMEGAILPHIGVAVISQTDLFGQTEAKSSPTIKGFGTTLSQLQPGDLVVHVDHGLGQFQGLERMGVQGLEQDYLLLTYAAGDKLYLPLQRINLLKRYGMQPTDSQPVRLDTLRNKTWRTRKKKISTAVFLMAQQLLQLHARRQLTSRRPYPPPDTLYREFESQFPFELTPDQQQATQQLIKDMQADQPMDRLLCGDVGYGKTEVAMRAAMLCVLGKRQVIVLAPTTVLAQQHAMTWKQRFAATGVRVAAMSRLQAATAVKQTLQHLAQGQLDIVVGTHRLLSRDVQIPKLGLVVVDEEQRFGIAAKEHLRRLKTQCDVLTLSATPIPRTLQMGLMGLRDMSVLQTPPHNRQAIRTSVARFDEHLIRQSIEQELQRGGQVYFIHNRVRSIDAMADYIAHVVPQARVAVAHGQMDKKQLQQIMLRFVQRQIHVLVCSSIVEAGLDIPTANTMLINRADTFGLSQLHQLRGRIGRSSQQAFAYLLIPASMQHLTQRASERLQTLQRFSDLGAGFAIAQQDLQLRGAGDLLGKAQHGHVAAVGMDLYLELLQEAVAQLRGRPQQLQQLDPDVKLPVAASISETYMPLVADRLSLYQRLATATSEQAVWDILNAVQDRNGHLPDEVNNLGRIMAIKIALTQLGATALQATYTNNDTPQFTFTFDEHSRLDPAKLVAWTAQHTQAARMTPRGQLLYTPTTAQYNNCERDLLTVAQALLQQLHDCVLTETSTAS